MENQTQVTPINQLEPQVVKNNNFLVILLSILLIIFVSIAVFFAFQNQKFIKELMMIKDKKGGDTSTVEITPPTANPILVNTNWKTYINSDFSYQYPEEWTEGQNGIEITSNISGVGITNFTKDMPMYNECMKLEITNITNGLMIKYYSYALGTEMCSNQTNINDKEAWITKVGGDGFQPGLIYNYNEVIYPNSLKLFDQILSTFKFTN